MLAKEIAALGTTPVEVKTFIEAGKNFELWLTEVANSKLALEVAEMVRVLTVYYQSTLDLYYLLPLSAASIA